MKLPEITVAKPGARQGAEANKNRGCMRTVLPKGVERELKRARKERRWAMINKAGRIWEIILAKAAAGSELAKSFQLFRAAMDRDASLAETAGLARVALDAFEALPEAQMRKLLNGWQHEYEYPTLASLRAIHGEVETPLMVYGYGDHLNIVREFHETHGDTAGVKVAVSLGMTRAAAVAAIRASADALEANWAAAMEVHMDASNMLNITFSPRDTPSAERALQRTQEALDDVRRAVEALALPPVKAPSNAVQTQVKASAEKKPRRR